MVPAAPLSRLMALAVNRSPGALLCAFITRAQGDGSSRRAPTRNGHTRAMEPPFSSEKVQAMSRMTRDDESFPGQLVFVLLIHGAIDERSFWRCATSSRGYSAFL